MYLKHLTNALGTWVSLALRQLPMFWIRKIFSSPSSMNFFVKRASPLIFARLSVATLSSGY